MNWVHSRTEANFGFAKTRKTLSEVTLLHDDAPFFIFDSKIITGFIHGPKQISDLQKHGTPLEAS